MTWRPGEPIVCAGCGAVYELGKYGHRRHPSPWCRYAIEAAREAGSVDVLAEQIRLGETYRGRKPSTWRRRTRRRGLGS